MYSRGRQPGRVYDSSSVSRSRSPCRCDPHGVHLERRRHACCESGVHGALKSPSDLSSEGKDAANQDAAVGRATSRQGMETLNLSIPPVQCRLGTKLRGLAGRETPRCGTGDSPIFGRDRGKRAGEPGEGSSSTLHIDSQKVLASTHKMPCTVRPFHKNSLNLRGVRFWS
jgi:hypothetical protein